MAFMQRLQLPGRRNSICKGRNNLEQWFNVSISVSSKIKNEQSYTLVVNKEDTIEDILETLAQISKFEYNFIDKNNIEIVKP